MAVGSAILIVGVFAVLCAFTLGFVYIVVKYSRPVVMDRDLSTTTGVQRAVAPKWDSDATTVFPVQDQRDQTIHFSRRDS